MSKYDYITIDWKIFSHKSNYFQPKSVIHDNIFTYSRTWPKEQTCVYTCIHLFVCIWLSCAILNLSAYESHAILMQVCVEMLRP